MVKKAPCVLHRWCNEALELMRRSICGIDTPLLLFYFAFRLLSDPLHFSRRQRCSMPVDSPCCCASAPTPTLPSSKSAMSLALNCAVLRCRWRSQPQFPRMAQLRQPTLQLIDAQLQFADLGQ